MSKLKETLDIMPNQVDLITWTKHQGNDGGFILAWTKKGTGFGQIAFFKKDGKIFCDTEEMGKEFVLEIFESFLNSCEIID